jgi:hypothetical protein
MCEDHNHVKSPTTDNVGYPLLVRSDDTSESKEFHWHAAIHGIACHYDTFPHME